jgi:glycosidase
LPVAPDYEIRNVEAQKDDPDSFLSLYTMLIALRNNSFTMKYGHIEVLDIEDQNVLGYTRTKEGEDEQFVVFINFSDESVRLTDAPVRKLIVSSNPQTKLHDALNGRIELTAHEGALFLKE